MNFHNPILIASFAIITAATLSACSPASERPASAPTAAVAKPAAEAVAPTAAAKPAAGATTAPSASASKPATGTTAGAAPKAPGQYVANGEADASSGKVSTQLLDTMRFQPNTFTDVQPGSSVTVEMTNNGGVVHNFFSPALGVTNPVKVSPGEDGTVTFKAPAAAGTYQFWCNEPGHGEAGMIGEVIVE